jgi:hypothetical protein
MRKGNFTAMSERKQETVQGLRAAKDRRNVVAVSDSDSGGKRPGAEDDLNRMNISDQFGRWDDALNLNVFPSGDVFAQGFADIARDHTDIGSGVHHDFFQKNVAFRCDQFDGHQGTGRSPQNRAMNFFIGGGYARHTRTPWRGTHTRLTCCLGCFFWSSRYFFLGFRPFQTTLPLTLMRYIKLGFIFTTSKVILLPNHRTFNSNQFTGNQGDKVRGKLAVIK